MSKKTKHATHGIHSKKLAYGKKAMHCEKPTSKEIIVDVNPTKTNTITIQVSKTITEAQKRRLERTGIRIVTVEDMVKRRGKNVVAFRKMVKPGYAFSVSQMGELSKKTSTSK